MKNVPYTTRTGLKIGLAYDPARQHRPTWSESQMQDAILQWAQRSGNDSEFTIGGDMHPLAEQQRKRAERRSKRVKRSVHKALRSAADGVVMLAKVLMNRKPPSPLPWRTK
jgi:hypothetical protein